MGMDNIMANRLKELKKKKSGTNTVEEVYVDKLKENPYQPRIEIKANEVKELANSIKEQGLIQPIIVTKTKDGSYYIIAGHRRTEAHKLLGKEKIKAFVIEADENQLASMAIVENLQREDLDLIETALALKRYKEKFDKTLDEVAIEIGKTKSWVSKILSVLNLPEKIIKDIKENKTTQDVNALNIINTFASKYKKFLMINFSKNADNTGISEEGISQKWENEVFELYQGFLKNGREWLKKEIEKRLKQEEKPKPKVEIKITKKHGITVKINEKLELDEVKQKEFEEELQKLIEKFKRRVK